MPLRYRARVFLCRPSRKSLELFALRRTSRAPTWNVFVEGRFFVRVIFAASLLDQSECFMMVPCCFVQFQYPRTSSSLGLKSFTRLAEIFSKMPFLPWLCFEHRKALRTTVAACHSGTPAISFSYAEALSQTILIPVSYLQVPPILDSWTKEFITYCYQITLSARSFRETPICIHL